MIHTPRKPAGVSWALCAVIALGAQGACTSSDKSNADLTAGSIEFFNVRVENIAARRAVVRFDTSVPATCEIEFGTAVDQLDKTATDPDMEPGELSVDHEVPLEDLEPATTYYFRARATDADSYTAFSEIGEFTTEERYDPTAELTNVALLTEGTRVVAVSSNWAVGSNDSGFGIHKALDGIDETQWSSNGDGNDAYVILDFGQPRDIRYFAYRSRMMNDGTSIAYRVQLLIDIAGIGEVLFGPFDTPDHTLRYVFALPEVITTSRIRFEVVDSTGGNTGAREIQFFVPEPNTP